MGEQAFSRADDGEYPPDGTAELCGSPAAWPEDFPNYPAGFTAEPAAGLDIGLGVNICDDTRLDGLDLIRDTTPDTAWTGSRWTSAAGARGSENDGMAGRRRRDR